MMDRLQQQRREVQLTQDEVLQKATFCKGYKGIDGLRRLQADQRDMSYYDVGCGWSYKASGGILPEVNEGIYGNASGPLDISTQGGAKYYWDLAQAEKEISKEICVNTKRCKFMALLGKESDVCGYCKRTQSVIPIQGQQARYPNDPSLNCAKEDIVTVKSGKCPEGFQGFQASIPQQVYRSEGFMGGMTDADMNRLFDCKTPLSRDCVLLASRAGGCTDKGSLIQALGTPGKGNYDSMLQDTRAFQAYKTNANPSLTRAVMADGSASIQVAIQDFVGLQANQINKNEKIRLAATDLCTRAGAYDDYDFCSEMTPTTKIDKTTIGCAQALWKKAGGTEAGTSYPTLPSWEAKTFQAVLDKIASLKQNLKVEGFLGHNKVREGFIVTKEENAQANKEFYGIESNVVRDLPKSEDTRGSETVWVDLGNISDDTSEPIIMKCDLNLSKNGDVIPRFSKRVELINKYSVPADNIGFINMFEIRPDQNMNVKFTVVTDDGFMIGQGQNPFEKTAYQGNDWGSWLYQAPTKYESSGKNLITSSAENQNNVIISKWFQGGGLATFTMDINGKDVNQNFIDRKDIYIVQEPLAPWMQYEVCTRQNSGVQRTELLETRWNGFVARTISGKGIPSFDVISNSVITQLDTKLRDSVPGKKGYISFTPSSWWHTRAKFAFTAFKTITLLVRPTGALTEGSSVSIFQHANFKGFSSGFYLIRTVGGGQYMFQHWDGRGWGYLPAVLNEWNMVVINYAGDSNGVQKISMHSETLTALKDISKRRLFLQELIRTKDSMGSLLVGTPFNKENAGYLVLGGTSSDYKSKSGKVEWTSQSFTGDIAWIHGFRNYIDTEDLLTAEITQTWQSRWRKNLL